jgi:hypothetical protein
MVERGTNTVEIQTYEYLRHGRVMSRGGIEYVLGIPLARAR